MLSWREQCSRAKRAESAGGVSHLCPRAFLCKELSQVIGSTEPYPLPHPQHVLLLFVQWHQICSLSSICFPHQQTHHMSSPEEHLARFLLGPSSPSHSKHLMLPAPHPFTCKFCLVINGFSKFRVSLVCVLYVGSLYAFYFFDKQIAILCSWDLQKELGGTGEINVSVIEVCTQGGCQGHSIGCDAENSGLLVPSNIWTILCYSKHLSRNF